MMFSPKYLVILIVIVIVLGGGLFWYLTRVEAPTAPSAPVFFRGPVGPPSIKGPTEPPPIAQPVQTGQKTWIVEYRNGTYTPKELTIKKGDKVTWINRVAEPTWPASAIHPTHGVYSEGGGCIGSKFDACRGLAANESYSFVFDRLGSWRYHDHLSPAITGTVNVIE